MFQTFLLFLAAMTGLAGTPVPAGCPSLVAIGCSTGIREGAVWFGRRWDGAHLGTGQSVRLDCASLLRDVEFQFFLQSQPGNGVPPLVPGDEVTLSVWSADQVLVGQTTTELAGPIDEPLVGSWIRFEFPGGGLALDPGPYLLLAETEAPRMASVGYCNVEDAYLPGARVTSDHGLFGPWLEPEGDLDLRLRMYLDPGPVGLSSPTWGSLKAVYR